FDPPSGIIVTANNRIVGQSYPYVITHECAAPYRARRIEELLESKPKLTSQDIRAIQGEVVSLGGLSFARAAVKMLMPQAKAENDEKLLGWLKQMDEWNGEVKGEYVVPIIVAQLRTQFRQKILSCVLGDKWRGYHWANSDSFVDKVIAEQPLAWLPAGFKNYAELLKKCFQDARTSIAAST